MTYPPEPQQPNPPAQGQPPAGYPPQYTPPPPPKKSRKGLIIGVVAGALVLCCGGGVIAVATGGGKSTPAAVASPAATGDAATPGGATPAGAQPVAPKTLLTLKGDGIRKSAIFTTGAEWSLAYTFDCSGQGGKGNFIVNEYAGSGDPQDVLVNQLESKGTDTVPVHASPGAHYLEMNSECSWTVTVTG